MKKLFAALLLLTITLTACAPSVAPNDLAPAAPEQSGAYEQGVTTRVVSLKGPTSMGLVNLMSESASENYEFAMYVGADEIVPLIAKGEADIALIPANLAAVLYQKTEGGVVVVNINTMSVLEVLTARNDITSVADLAGKTIYMTGKGTVPEYTLRYLLSRHDLTLDDVKLEFKTEPTEVVSALGQNAEAVGILPQPFATVALGKSEDLKTVLHLGEEWDAVSENGSGLVTGVTIVRRAFMEEHPSATLQFLADHASSVEMLHQDVTQTAARVEEYGIINAAVAEKAIPFCNIVSLTGDTMKTTLSGYLQVLFDMAPEAVGGKLPDEAFYFQGN